MLQPLDEPGTVVLRDTLLQMYRASIGTSVWRNLWMLRDGTAVDILDDGDLSCAWFITCPLYIAGLIHASHTWVRTAIDDLRTSGWIELHNIAFEAGDVVVWGTSPTHRHLHFGICVSETEAISNSSIHRTPQLHNIVLHDRPIMHHFRHPMLDSSIPVVSQ